MARTRNLGNLTDLLTANTGTGIVTATDPGQFDRTGALATTNWVKNSGKRYSQFIQNTAGPITLTASAAGKLIDYSTAYTGTTTLPLASTLDDGETITFWSGASAAFNIVVSGSDNIFTQGSTVTSITLNNGDTLELTKFGPLGTAGSWVATGGSAQLKWAGVFASASNYQKLPSGIIMQWGTATITSANVFQSVTLPLAYPTAHLNFLCTSSTLSAYAIGGTNSGSKTTGSVSSSAASGLVYWLSIGN